MNKEELLKLYNEDLDTLLQTASKYIKNDIEFCSLMQETENVHKTANIVLKVLITAQILNLILLSL